MCPRGKTGERVWTPREKRAMMQRRAFREILRLRISPPFRCEPYSYSATGTEDARYADVPKPRRRKSERKPYPTPMKVLIRRAKEEKAARKAEPCRILQPPENGLLVPELVHVARRVNQARESLLDGLSKLAGVVVPVKRCRYCSEIHIGHVGHEIRTCSGAKNGLRNSTHVWRTGCLADMVCFPYCYHLHDRVGKPRVGHDERFQVKRLPAILELCIQAGLDHEDYPTRRRTKPVYSIEGRIVDFEPEMEHEDVEGAPQAEDPLLSFQSNSGDQNSCHYEENSNELSVKTLESWLEMKSGAELMMKTYSVKTCGYCPEVQVGPKGHKVRMCKAARHQFRNGLHAWQEATIDDLIWPNYVWHVRDPHGPTLANELKRYYGKAPAVVELCMQAGAPVPDEYQSMMRLDVVSPDRDEVDLVA
ncbi:APO protein 3, mitochondrial isoform X2 [Magnolia sinica]|uniref:APO protein 3, mitochondrial isoform X2 n=1 Tax=Magnolia sinica TaxID=86752 RepID=UPI00265915BE|nr:APO protein 3, mitochondrial isoform X2 [Magnolia sinica]XP_058092909.1 APO protein 3, mitochondrial isoform X2 [Magnolia sinica]XP_058092910.1 APO protein 3, mitochondrial isoform X2 [Magnolia sinica]